MGFVSLPVLRLSSDIVLNPGCSSLCVDHVISLRRTCAEPTSLHGAHSLVTCAFTMARTSLVLCFFVCIDLAHIRTKGTPKSRCSSKGRAAPAGTAGLHGCECWAVSADDVGFIHQVETGQLAPVVGSREECKGRAAAAGGTATEGRAAPAGTAGLHGCACWAVSADDVSFIHQVETDQLAPVVGSREECKGRAAAAGGTATEGRAAPAGTAGLHGCACWAVSADDVGAIHQVETGRHASIVGRREASKGRAAAAGGTATEGRAAPAGTAGLHGCACWAVSADDVGSIRQVETGRHASIVGRRAASKGRAASAGIAGLHGCQCWAVSADDVGSIHQVETGRDASIAERYVAQRSGAGHSDAG